jgi:hypothetical protein
MSARDPVGDVGSLLDRAASALYRRGDLHDSRQWFDRAFLAAERAGDADGLAQAAVGGGGLWVHEDRSSTGGALLRVRLNRALAHVDPASSPGVRMRARLAAETDYGAGHHDRGLAVLEEARRLDDPEAIAEAANLVHQCVLGPEHSDLRRALARELIEAGVRTGRRSDRLLGMVWHTVDLLLDADPRALRRLNELRAEVEEQDHLAVGFVTDAIDVMLTVRAGSLDEAETMATVCAKRGSAAGDARAVAWHVGHLVNIRWYQARMGEMAPMLADLVHSPTLSAADNSMFAALAVAAATAGDRRGAASALAVLSGPDLARLPRSVNWLVTMNGVVEASHLLGDVPTAGQAYKLLIPHAHLPMTAGLAVACFGSVHHALGVAAQTVGDLDTAVGHFDHAVRQNLALSHWPAVAAARLRWAQVLTQRGGPDDHAAASALRALAAADTETGSIGDAINRSADRTVGCMRQGQQWHMVWRGRRVAVADSVGLTHLAVLLNNPDREIACLELVAGLDTLSRKGVAGTSRQPVLDRTAIHSYRARISRLAADIEDLETAGDRERAAAARHEYDWLVSELSAGTGIGGTSRTFADSAERARTAVGKAIRRALAGVERVDAELARHLRQAVRTGVTCSYRPG